jgi:alpha-galactosidase
VFSTVSPRQPVTPAPQALYAVAAGTAASANSVSASNITGTIVNSQLSSNIPPLWLDGLSRSLATNLTVSSVSNGLISASTMGTFAALEARRTEKPHMGFGTYLMNWNGTNQYAGGGEWNIYCNPNEELVLQTCTNYINDGLLALGYKWVFLAGGWWTGDDSSGGWDYSRFPSGGVGFVNKLHALGFKLALYTDLLTAYSCGVLSIHADGPDSGIAFAANTLTSLGVDYLWIDTQFWLGSGPAYELARRYAYERFLLALRATNSNIGVAMNMNATPYSAWIGETFNGWQIAPNLDAPNWEASVASMDQSALSAAQFRRGHTPYWYEFNMGALMPREDVYHQGIYGNPLLNVAGAAMWQSDLHWPGDTIANDARFLSVGWGDVQTRLLQTNSYIIRIDQDDLFVPPARTFQNGTVEGWTKPLADGSTALLVFNRGYATNVTATSITIPITAFGFTTNASAVFTECVAFTNATVSGAFTIQCNTNSCSLWVVNRANPLKVPTSAIGINTPSAGQVLKFDGTNMYWANP